LLGFLRLGLKFFCAPRSICECLNSVECSRSSNVIYMCECLWQASRAWEMRELKVKLWPVWTLARWISSLIRRTDYFWTWHLGLPFPAENCRPMGARGPGHVTSTWCVDRVEIKRIWEQWWLFLTLANLTSHKSNFSTEFTRKKGRSFDRSNA
jgi:hypothetical protein